jgi:hypothetical protein
VGSRDICQLPDKAPVPFTGGLLLLLLPLPHPTSNIAEHNRSDNPSRIFNSGRVRVFSFCVGFPRINVALVEPAGVYGERKE